MSRVIPADSDSGAEQLSAKQSAAKQPTADQTARSARDGRANLPIAPAPREKRFFAVDAAAAHATPEHSDGAVPPISKDRSPFLSCVVPEGLWENNSSEEKRLIGQALARTLRAFLAEDKAIFLERVGMLYRKVLTRTRVRVENQSLLIGDEVRVVPEFEKGEELLEHHRLLLTEQRVGSAGIVQMEELSAKVFAELPLALRARWHPGFLTMQLRGLCGVLRQQLEQRGVSRTFRQFGVFYATGVGASTEFPFAGLDVFLDTAIELESSWKPLRTLERPKMRRGWELFAAEFGEPEGSFQLPVSDAVFATLSTEVAAALAKVEVVAWKLDQSENSRWLLLTEGMRDAARAANAPELPELILEIPSSGGDAESIPTWAGGVLSSSVIGVLEYAELLRPRRIELGLLVRAPVLSAAESGAPQWLDGVVAIQSPLVPLPQLVGNAECRFLHLIGITALEGDFAEQFSVSSLVALLRRRGISRFTPKRRMTVVGRTSQVRSIDPVLFSPSGEPG